MFNHIVIYYRPLKISLLDGMHLWLSQSLSELQAGTLIPMRKRYKKHAALVVTSKCYYLMLVCLPIPGGMQYNGKQKVKSESVQG